MSSRNGVTARKRPRVRGDTGAVSRCARGDLNPHVRRHWNLNPARMPISPLARGVQNTQGQGYAGAAALQSSSGKSRARGLVELERAPQASDVTRRLDV